MTTLTTRSCTSRHLVITTSTDKVSVIVTHVRISCIPRQQTSRQFVMRTSKDLVLASSVLTFCIYVKRPRPSHYPRVTFCIFVITFRKCVSISRMTSFENAEFSAYLVKRPRTSPYSCIYFLCFCDYFVFVRVHQNETTPPFRIPYGNIARRA